MSTDVGTDLGPNVCMVKARRLLDRVARLEARLDRVVDVLAALTARHGVHIDGETFNGYDTRALINSNTKPGAGRG